MEGLRLRMSFAAEVLDALDKAIECEQNLRGVVKTRADLIDQAAREWLTARGYPIGKSRLKPIQAQVKPQAPVIPVQEPIQAVIQQPDPVVAAAEDKERRAWVKKYCREANQARKTTQEGETRDA